jgi:hypothetical protein
MKIGMQGHFGVTNYKKSSFDNYKELVTRLALRPGLEHQHQSFQ